MKKYTLEVPSTQKEIDWFHFVNESLKHTKGIDNLEVDFQCQIYGYQ